MATEMLASGGVAFWLFQLAGRALGAGRQWSAPVAFASPLLIALFVLVVMALVGRVIRIVDRLRQS
jgi:hypothetical protein